MLLEINNAGSVYTIQEPIQFACGVTVPAGFASDLATIPKALWWIWGPTGNYKRSAILHDWLYFAHRHDLHQRTRVECDRLFRDQMCADGVGWKTRTIFYLAVRVCGRRWW